MKVIQLTRNKKAKVNDEDFDFLNQWKWQCGNKGYAIRSQHLGWDGKRYGKKSVLMHRVVMQAVDGQEVDHINGDRLDNRRENLRLVTRLQNTQNSKVWNLKGVSRKAKGTRGLKRYVARINVNKKTIFLGDFHTPEEAHQAYLVAAKKYFGNYFNGG